jgi:hypothetical protein
MKKAKLRIIVTKVESFGDHLVGEWLVLSYIINDEYELYFVYVLYMKGML